MKIFTKPNQTGYLRFLLIVFSLASFNSMHAQYVFEDWVSTSGTQDFYYYGKSVTDASKNVYQVGATFNTDGHYDAIVTKYKKDGTEIWTKTFDGPTNGDDTFTDIALNGSSVLITGTSLNSSETSAEVFTISINGVTGNTNWSDRYSYSGSIYNVGAAITIDGSNNVYIAGASFNANTFSDVMMMKYNSSGIVQWANTEDANKIYSAKIIKL